MSTEAFESSSSTSATPTSFPHAPSDPHTVPTRLIIGIIVGVVALAMVLACFCCKRYRHRRREESAVPRNDHEVNPFMRPKLSSEDLRSSTRSQKRRAPIENSFTSTPFIPLHNRDPSMPEGLDEVVTIEEFGRVRGSNNVYDTHPIDVPSFPSTASVSDQVRAPGDARTLHPPPIPASLRAGALSSSSFSPGPPSTSSSSNLLGRAAVHRDELYSQVQDMQQTVADLQAEQPRRIRRLPRPPESSGSATMTGRSFQEYSSSSSAGREASDNAFQVGPDPNNKASPHSNSTEEELRRQIVELQAEVERLRAQQVGRRQLESEDEDDAPPQYMREDGLGVLYVASVDPHIRDSNGS